MLYSFLFADLALFLGALPPTHASLVSGVDGSSPFNVPSEFLARTLAAPIGLPSGDNPRAANSSSLGGENLLMHHL
jgi:hypothetical protein